MRKLKIANHISLDGVIQVGAPGDDKDFPYGDWSGPYRTPEGRDAVLAAYGGKFDLLLGRRTYDYFKLLAEDAEQSDGGRDQRREEIRRDPPAGRPGVGPFLGHGPDISRAFAVSSRRRALTWSFAVAYR